MESPEKSVEDFLKWIIVIILCFIIVLIIFITGVFVGQEKARFSFTWAENYHQNFSDPVHGIFGSVIGIDRNSLIIKGQDSMERIVIVSNNTIIMDQRHQIGLLDIRPGSSIVVVGDPNEHGLIEAKLIRVLPKNSMMPMSLIYEYSTPI